jgi:hypothetical protein
MSWSQGVLVRFVRLRRDEAVERWGWRARHGGAGGLVEYLGWRAHHDGVAELVEAGDWAKVRQLVEVGDRAKARQLVGCQYLERSAPAELVGHDRHEIERGGYARG